MSVNMILAEIELHALFAEYAKEYRDIKNKYKGSDLDSWYNSLYDSTSSLFIEHFKIKPEIEEQEKPSTASQFGLTPRGDRG